MPQLAPPTGRRQWIRIGDDQGDARVQASYSELIDDHARIVSDADLLLDGAAKARPDPARLARQMHDLGILVREHLSVEGAVIALCDARPLPTPGRRAFIDGRDQFDELRRDWLAFLAEWAEDVIACDPAGFQEAAETMLGRVKQCVAAETEGSTPSRSKPAPSASASITAAAPPRSARIREANDVKRGRSGIALGQLRENWGETRLPLLRRRHAKHGAAEERPHG